MTHTVSSDTRKIGKWMLVFFWLALLILLTLVFNKIETQRDNPNQTPLTQTDASGTQTVILQPNRYGYYQVNGSINQHPVTFLLDTGASHVAIPLVLASQLELIPGAKSSSTTANGITQTYRTQINALQIGPIHLRNIEGTLLPNMKGQQILLGMSALQKLNFTQQDKQLILRQR